MIRRWRDALVAAILPGQRPPDPTFWAELDAGAETRFRNGQALPFEGPEGLCGVYGRDGVVGLGRAEAGRLLPVRLTITQDAEKHQKNL